MDNNKITLSEITDQLLSLKDSGVVGIKQSFEDEGVILEDVSRIKRLCDKLDLKLNVKIGGCEAISDINNCLLLEASGIVAPMIESEFALEKFVESIIANTDDKDRSLIDFFINIESKTSIENLDKILSSPSSKLLKGIVVGRSDLTKSFGYGKQEVNSQEICEIVENTFREAKAFNFTTTMGGNIGNSSNSSTPLACKFLRPYSIEGLPYLIANSNSISSSMSFSDLVTLSEYTRRGEPSSIQIF